MLQKKFAFRLGNLVDIASYGSLHEFLVDLHNKFGEVASFWKGQELIVSLASADAFQDISSVKERPSKFLKTRIFRIMDSKVNQK